MQRFIFIIIVLFSCHTAYAQKSEYLKDGFSILESMEKMNFEILKLNDLIEEVTKEKQESLKRLNELREELQNHENQSEKISLKLRQIAYLNSYLKNVNPFFIFMSVRDYSEFTRSLRLTKLLLENHLKALLALQETLLKIRTVEFKMTIEQAHSYYLERTLTDAKDQLKEEIEAKKSLLDKIAKDFSLNSKMEKELMESYNDFNNKILAMPSGLKTGSVFESLQSRLKMPISNAIVIVPFGKKIHPVFKTATNHNGWKLSSPNWNGEIKNVRAVAFGRVVFTGNIKGFGNAVLIDHAGGYHTLYTGLLKATVREGEMIRERDILGKIGMFPGDSKGRPLYFEIRKDSKPVDPALWMEKTM
jgi:septal ring factor EnvC (AmiA/AmiB activator)